MKEKPLYFFVVKLCKLSELTRASVFELVPKKTLDKEEKRNTALAEISDSSRCLLPTKEPSYTNSLPHRICWPNGHHQTSGHQIAKSPQNQKVFGTMSFQLIRIFRSCAAVWVVRNSPPHLGPKHVTKQSKKKTA